MSSVLESLDCFKDIEEEKDFTKDHELGSGSFGQVFKYIDQKDKSKSYAGKVIKLSYLDMDAQIYEYKNARDLSELPVI